MLGDGRWVIGTEETCDREDTLVGCDGLVSSLEKKVPCCSYCHALGLLQKIRLETGEKGEVCCEVLWQLLKERSEIVYDEVDDLLRSHALNGCTKVKS